MFIFKVKTINFYTSIYLTQLHFFKHSQNFSSLYSNREETVKKISTQKQTWLKEQAKKSQRTVNGKNTII